MRTLPVLATILLAFGANASTSGWKEYVEVDEFTSQLKRAGASVLSTNAESGVIAVKLVCLGVEPRRARYLVPLVLYKGNDAIGKKIKVEYRVDDGAISVLPGLVDSTGVAGIVHVFTASEVEKLSSGGRIAFRVTGDKEFVGSFTLKGFADSYAKLSEVCR